MDKTYVVQLSTLSNHGNDLPRCLDDEYIWVTEYCLGWFRRGKSQGACLSDAGPTVQRSAWAYDEARRVKAECQSYQGLSLRQKPHMT